MGNGDRGSESNGLPIDIRPAPTTDERDAVVAALTVWLETLAETEHLGEPPPSRWQAAARRSAVLGLNGGASVGWGRRRGGW